MKGVLAMPLSMTLEPVQKQQLTQHLIQQMNLLQMTSEELDANLQLSMLQERFLIQKLYILQSHTIKLNSQSRKLRNL